MTATDSTSDTGQDSGYSVFDAMMHQMRIRQEQIDQEEDAEKKKLLRKKQEDFDNATDIVKAYLRPDGISISKDHKITYFASQEDSRKWLENKTILDPDTKKPTEFIGVHRGLTVSRHLTEADAFAIIALARTKGWPSVKLHGKQDEKDKLWLAAQRQDMAVDMTGYIPSKDIEKRWLEEQAALEASKAEKALAGVSPASLPQAQPTAGPAPQEQSPLSPPPQGGPSSTASAPQAVAPPASKALPRPYKDPKTVGLRTVDKLPVAKFKSLAASFKNAAQFQRTISTAPYKTPKPALPQQTP